MSKNFSIDRNVIYGLWCICHPADGVRYVGQTKKGMTARFGVHLAHSETMQSPVYNWIRKHGTENIAYTVLEVCIPEELDAREEAWIALYREEQGAKLMNVKLGGGASKGHKNPKQSVAMTGEANPMWRKDRKEIMAHARSFQNLDSERMSEVARARGAYSHSDESRERMRSRARESWTDERKANAARARTGTGSNTSKVDEDDVREIRRIRAEQSLTYADIASRYEMSPIAISRICRRITWKHVD